MEGVSTYAIVPFISGLCNVLIDRLLSENTRELLVGRDSTVAELSKLKTSLIVVDKVVNDAEWKQLTSPDVRRWLNMVRHAVYDAEDLLDEILTDAHQLDTLSTKFMHVLSSLNPFREDVGSKIQKLNLRFEAFGPMITDLQLENFTGKRLPNSWQLSSEVVDESQIFGRETEKEEIVKLLEDGVKENYQPPRPNKGKSSNPTEKDKIVKVLEDRQSTKGKGSSSTYNRIRIVAIVGMAGIGKTTLAQLIFNDPTVLAIFPFRAWACVPGEVFDVISTIKDLLISSEEPSSSMSSITFDANLGWVPRSFLLHKENLGWLQKRLQHEVAGKKTLVVLDDVWDENLTADCFDKLLIALGFAAPGSTIILTTHNEDIARMLHPTHTLHLNELPDADCRHLFKMRAFGDPHAYVNENVEAIITTLLAKCKGLPLAVRAIGDLVSKSSKPTDDLQTYASSNIWDLPLPKEILPSLYLTYLHLPPELRRCFAYCSIFPKNYRFEKDKLIMLWMAEGFIVQEPHDNRRMEDVGTMYFDNLSARSFFQVSAAKSQFFVMHDLIHDLAVYLFRDFGLLKSELSSVDIAKNLRHFSFMQSKYDTLGSLWRNDGRSNHLRTFLPVRPYSIDQPFLSNGLLQSLKVFGPLRALSLCGYRIISIPPTIGNLKQLRYLDFSSTLIEELPDTICDLSNLQTLLLFDCQYLRKLPKMMRNLIRLRQLDIRGTFSLQEMPDLVGSLSCLQTLTDFVVGVGHEKSIRQLGRLKLRGSLLIRGLEKVVDNADAVAANLQDKTYLDEIALMQSNDTIFPQQDLLDAFKPHTSLRRLTISLYNGDHFPNWLGCEAFCHLTVLNLVLCSNWVQLPPLGQLPSLGDLHISGLDKIETLGPEFYGEHRESSPFNSLVTLKFEGLGQWRNWLSYDGDVMPFASLQKLCISQCGQLEAKIPLNLPSLIELEVIECKNICGSLPQSPNLRKLSLSRFGELELSNLADLNCLTDLSLRWGMLDREKDSIALAQSALPLLTSLENLTMEFMPLRAGALVLLRRRWEFPPLIRTITIEDCGGQVIDIEGCSNIQCFKIRGCTSIVKLPTGNGTMLNDVELIGLGVLLQVMHEGNEDGLESLYELSICKYRMLHYPSLLLTARNLTTLSLTNCSGLSSLPTEMAAHYPCLQFLFIVRCEDLTSILEDDLPTQLKTLEIIHCGNLTSLPERMYTCTSLQRLVVRNCTRLLSLPGNGLPPNLHELQYYEDWRLYRLNQYYEDWRLCRLTSLQNLSLRGFTKTQSFPAGGSLPTSLTVLSLIRFQELRSINCSELQRIPSLRELEISFCRKLRSFSEGELPESLCRLTIKKSPLAARCRKPDGHYADMASRITCLELDLDRR